MDIRSVTLFINPDFEAAQAASFFSAAREAFTVPVQTTRLALTPFPDWWSRMHEPADEAATLAQHWQATGADYISLGPIRLGDEPYWLQQLPTILGSSDSLFASVEIADQQGHIDPARCLAAAELIQQMSTVLDNGFGNLYLTAIANCPPGSPFFPVAYHGGGPANFALAIEGADLALTAVQSASTLAEARHNLIVGIESQAAQLESQAAQLAEDHNIPFSGLDFSLAPYPTADKSLAGALEAFGLSALGAPGSLFTAAFITDAIGRAEFERCGFSGLMLPVLEDSVLATRAAEGAITITDLLSYAAVCGVGLDTIPLPGAIEQATLSGILLDIAALACRLDKPLTARLMPLPGLNAGDPVHFDFPYFADSQVMAVRQGNTHLLAEEQERLMMSTYQTNA